MSIVFKPLEESVTKLALYVKKDDVKGFMAETKVFYQKMGVLARYDWMKVDADRMCNRYQTQYDQLKMQIGISSKVIE